MSREAMSAFPIPAFVLPHGDVVNGDSGMSLREYAAIALLVPDSGEPAIDAMILARLRNDFAKAAMQSILSAGDVAVIGPDANIRRRATQAFLVADAMLSASSRGGSK